MGNAGHGSASAIAQFYKHSEGSEIMDSRTRLAHLALFILSCIFLATFVYADSAPPHINFQIQYEVMPAPSLINATVLACRAADCSDAHAPGQRMSCGQEGCAVLIYEYAPYVELQMQFSDRNRISNIFAGPAYSREDNVRVLADRLEVNITQDIFNPPPTIPSQPDFPSTPASGAPGMPSLIDIGAALIVTETIELTVAGILFALWKKPMSLLMVVLGVNVITVPGLWILQSVLMGVGTVTFYYFMPVFLLLEAAVVIFEAIALWKLSAHMQKGRKQKQGSRQAAKLRRGGLQAKTQMLSGLQALGISLLMNAASAIGGILLLALLAIIGI